MYDLLLFDFDGVLFNTNKVKTRAFELSLKDYPADKVVQFIDYHEKNGGISRHLKFKYFFEEILQSPNSKTQQNKAVDDFAMHCEQLQKDAQPLPGVAQFLSQAASMNIPMAICSGGNTNEISFLLKKFKLDHYFTHIWGNEKTKTEHAEQSIQGHYHKVYFFGDARYDMEVAEAFGFSFCFMFGVSDWPIGKDISVTNGHLSVEDFRYLYLEQNGNLVAREVL